MDYSKATELAVKYFDDIVVSNSTKPFPETFIEGVETERDVFIVCIGWNSEGKEIRNIAINSDGTLHSITSDAFGSYLLARDMFGSNSVTESIHGSN